MDRNPFLTLRHYGGTPQSHILPTTSQPRVSSPLARGPFHLADLWLGVPSPRRTESATDSTKHGL